MKKEVNHWAPGAFTFDANDYNWCCSNVRRLFDVAEQKMAEAIRPFMFELNKRTTWSRIRTVTDNFLLFTVVCWCYNGNKIHGSIFYEAVIRRNSDCFRNDK